MTDERIIAYLLEELPEKEQEQFEDECFAQETWPEQQIELVEEDLIEAYLRKELIPERRQRFEQNYLTTDARHKRVTIAAALLRHIDKHTVTPPSEPTSAERFRAWWSNLAWGLRPATAIAIVAVISVAVLLSRAPSPPRTYVSLTLSIRSNTRGEGVQSEKVKLSPNTEALNVTLTLPQQSPAAVRYRVELENDNRERKSAEVAGSDAQSVLVVIPAAQLTREQYALKLFATTSDGNEQRINGSYFFVVE